MTNIQWLWDALAWLSVPLLWLLAGLFVRRKYYRDFPFFFAYVVVASLAGVLRFVVYGGFSQRAYFYTYWFSDFVVVTAAFLAIYETFLRRVFPGFFKQRLYRYLFPAVAVALGLLAFLTALLSPDKNTAYFATTRVFDILRSAVIGFFVMLVLLVGREFSGYEFNIALGFGIQAAVAIISAALTARAQYKASALARFEPIAFDLACVIWLFAFWKKPKPASAPQAGQLSPEMLDQAKSWESSLKDLVKSKKRSE